MDSTKQQTWGGRFKELPSDKMLSFGESISFDARLAPYDIRCSKAHASMLAHVGLINETEKAAMHSGLDQIQKAVESGEFEWDIHLEDVHMNIEQALVNITPAGAKLHTARSRNDQVATDMHLYIKEASDSMIALLASCISALLKHAKAHLTTPAPSYTHLQRAQPITLAHYLLAWVEMLARDLEEFKSAHELANVCPLGSGALAGSTLPIDREFSAKALGFVDTSGNPVVTTNSLDTVASRDVILKFTFACAQTATHIARLSEDWIIWASSEFDFIQLPDSYTTGSSLMPQKRNPDALELARGKSARIIGDLQTLFTLIKGLPLTYNRDLQEDKPAVFDAHDQTAQILDLLADLIHKTDFKIGKLKAAALDPMLFATDVADYLVDKGIAFRDSHHIVGKVVAMAEAKSVGIDQLSLEELQKISDVFEADYAQIFDFNRSIERRAATGMPNPSRNKKAIETWEQFLAANVKA
jgi:argininosuccinate lyase